MLNLKDKDQRNKYMRDYHRRHYAERMEEIRAILGGACATLGCRSTIDLQIDHKDPKSKRFAVSLLTARRDLLEQELKKCQLLCAGCHSKKSVLERGQKLARDTHGTVSAYRHCGPPKCDACKEAKRNTQRIWRAQQSD